MKLFALEECFGVLVLYFARFPFTSQGTGFWKKVFFGFLKEQEKIFSPWLFLKQTLKHNMSMRLPSADELEQLEDIGKV